MSWMPAASMSAASPAAARQAPMRESAWSASQRMGARRIVGCDRCVVGDVGRQSSRRRAGEPARRPAGSCASASLRQLARAPPAAACIRRFGAHGPARAHSARRRGQPRCASARSVCSSVSAISLAAARQPALPRSAPVGRRASAARPRACACSAAARPAGPRTWPRRGRVPRSSGRAPAGDGSSRSAQRGAGAARAGAASAGGSGAPLRESSTRSAGGRGSGTSRR